MSWDCASCLPAESLLESAVPDQRVNDCGHSPGRQGSKTESELEGLKREALTMADPKCILCSVYLR